MARAAATGQAKATKAPAKPVRRARGSLSQEEILDGAYRVVAEEGLMALSMPALARELRAGVTSIYWYFRSKDDLLVALAERVVQEVYSRMPPVGDGPWDEELVRYFSAFRRELRRMPVFLQLFSMRPRFIATRPHVFETLSRRLEDEVGVFVKLGLPPVEAARLYTACSVYTRGFVMLEHGYESELAAGDPAVLTNVVGDAVNRLDPAHYPVLSQLPDFAPFTLDDEQFAGGLQLLIAGIRSTAEAVAARPAPRRKRS
ncbi:MAG: TetR/AcrR family transcriptional regulator [Actinomycetota bacterium]|jgi:AcrR family transcriptional regulator